MFYYYKNIHKLLSLFWQIYKTSTSIFNSIHFQSNNHIWCGSELLSSLYQELQIWLKKPHPVPRTGKPSPDKLEIVSSWDRLISLNQFRCPPPYFSIVTCNPTLAAVGCEFNGGREFPQYPNSLKNHTLHCRFQEGEY